MNGLGCAARQAAALLAAVALALGALFWPFGAAAPLPWTPPPAPALSGSYAPNDALAAATPIAAGGHGPEDVAVGADGALYTGLGDGRIVRLRAGRPPETFATTGGRPLGLRFGPEGVLYVADAERGLLGVSPDGRVELLARAHGGIPFGLTDDLDVAADGTVYFSDASSRVGLGQSVRDVVEQHPSGRLLAYRRDRGVRLLHDGLYFANGVALAPDESYLLVAETARYRLRRCALRGERAGRCDVFAADLPGFPDGVTRGTGGTFWVALVSPRSALLDRVHPYPWLKRALLRLPQAVRPGPRAYGFVLGIEGDGRVVHNLQDPAGRGAAFVTNVVEHEGDLFLGSLERDAVARVRRP
jgi:sugar lactone lactonase YvrE